MPLIWGVIECCINNISPRYWHQAFAGAEFSNKLHNNIPATLCMKRISCLPIQSNEYQPFDLTKLQLYFAKVVKSGENAKSHFVAGYIAQDYKALLTFGNSPFQLKNISPAIF